MKIKTIDQAKELGLHTYTYPNGDWDYRDTKGYWHIFRNGKELLPEIKKMSTYSYPNGDWEYCDTNIEWHTIKGDNNEN